MCSQAGPRGAVPNSSPCLAWILPSALPLGSGPTQGAGRHPSWLCDSLEFSQIGAGPACLPWCLPSVQTPILRLVTLWGPDHCVRLLPTPCGCWIQGPLQPGGSLAQCVQAGGAGMWGGVAPGQGGGEEGWTLALGITQRHFVTGEVPGAVSELCQTVPQAAWTCLSWLERPGVGEGCPHWCSPGSLPPAMLFQTLFVSTHVLGS